MKPDYITTLRHLIAQWRVAEQLLDSDDDNRQFYIAAIQNAEEHINEHSHDSADLTS
jgi:ribosomal protein S15P/S13E